MFSFITTPIHDILVYLAQATGDLGVAIVLLTLIIRVALIPLTFPGQKKQIQNRDKMRKLKPRINELRKKYKDDKPQFAKAQMELYREHDIQLFSWSTIISFVQIVFLIALFHVLQNYLQESQVQTFSNVLGMNLLNPDSTYILPILAFVLQLILSAMLLPGLEHHDVVPEAEEKRGSKKKKSKKSLQNEMNEDENDIQDQAEAMTQQMMFIMPAITAFFASRFPAGVALYWVVTTLFSVVQQYFISGPGGLVTVYHKVRQNLQRSK